MRISLFYKIGGSFLLGIGIILITLFFLGLGELQKIVFHDISQKAQNFSFEAVKYSELFLAGIDNILKSLSEKESLKAGKIEDIDKVLEYYAKNYTLFGEEVFEDFIVVDKEGIVLTTYPKKLEYIGLNYSFYPFYQEIIKGKDKYFSSKIQISFLSDRPIAEIAIPIKDDKGDFSLIIVAHINLASISQLSQELKIGEKGYIIVLDTKGYFISHPNKNVVLEHYHLNALFPGLIEEISESKGTVLWPKKNPQFLVSWSTSPFFGWKVMFVQEIKEAFKITEDLRKTFPILSGSFLVSILIVNVLISQTIIRPIREFEKITKRVAKGDLKTEIKIKTGDEIEELGKNFNLMLEALRAHQEALEESKKVLEIRVQARTRELRELTEKQEEIIKTKTEELREKIKELEKSQTALLSILEDAEKERQVAEEERDKTLAIISNFADGLLVFDKEGKVSLINPQAENFLKVKGKEVIGKSILELSQFPDFKPIAEAVGEELKGIFRKEVPIREDLILEATTVPIMREEEKIGTLMILHDVTREKMIERMKTEFVSISAHQLRTPLSAIKWTLKMLLDGDLGEVTKEQKEFLDKIYQSNERMINLINDLLNVARIEEGRYIYKPVLANIVPICQSIINSSQTEIERKKLKVVFKTSKELPKVKVDIEKISLAIQNLVENAIRYNKEGGEIEINIEKKDKEIQFTIKDTGIGIPKSEQSRVFSKFYRGSNALRMETEGSGLGLFITKNIIEAHGGRIWFESEEGKGTTFYFTLPVAF
jgi:PAS domain S-box-containing protein